MTLIYEALMPSGLPGLCSFHAHWGWTAVGMVLKSAVPYTVLFYFLVMSIFWGGALSAQNVKIIHEAGHVDRAYTVVGSFFSFALIFYVGQLFSRYQEHWSSAMVGMSRIMDLGMKVTRGVRGVGPRLPSALIAAACVRTSCFGSAMASVTPAPRRLTTTSHTCASSCALCRSTRASATTTLYPPK